MNYADYVRKRSRSASTLSNSVEPRDPRAFEIARPRILGALLDSVVHGLRAMGGVQFGRLPRVADFAVWPTACERALWPAGTFARAYTANRRATIESVIEADPIATCVRAMMVDRTRWTGSASDLLRFCAECDDIARGGSWVAKNPRALAGRLRRAQTFLRTLGIEITFSREGRTGTRMIKLSRPKSQPIMTGIGSVAVRCPRVRDRVGEGSERIRFSSAVLPPYARRSKSLEVLIPILYLKGVSTG